MLDDFDKELEKGAGDKVTFILPLCGFARYADDFIILVKSQRAGERVLANVTKLLKKTFKLTVNEAKSQVVPTNQCSFWGFTFKGKKTRWTEKSYGKFIKRLKELTSRTWGVPMEYRLQKLAEYIRGWMGYYRLSEYYLPIDGIDSWLRRRIRMCYLKMWGRMKTIARRLLALGVPVQQAVGLGRSRKKWWGRSKNPVINKALSDKYLAKQGLISIKDLWVQFHYPK